MENELYHHGVHGMKWGRRNGPPYPLDAEGKADLHEQRKTEKQVKVSSITSEAINAGRKVYEKFKDMKVSELQQKLYKETVKKSEKAMKNWVEANKENSTTPNIKEILDAKDKMIDAGAKYGCTVDVSRGPISGFDFTDPHNGRYIFIEAGNKNPEKALASLKVNSTDQSDYIYIDSNGKIRKN